MSLGLHNQLTTYKRKRQLWTPSDLSGLAAWYDAAAITGLSDGDPVSTWEDSSTANRDIDNTGTARPTYQTAELNGKPVVEFDGTNDYLYRTSAFLYDLGTATTAWVAKRTGTAVTSIMIGEGRSSNNTPGYQVARTNTTGNWAWVLRDDAEGLAGPTTTVTGNNAFKVVLLEDTTTAVKHAANGAAYSQATTYTRGTTTLDRFSVGCNLRTYAGEFFAGQIAEIVIVDAALSSTEKEQLEGYLAHKWGLSADLPSNHPYKYEPPYKVEPERIVTDGLVLNLDAGDYASYPRSGTTWYDISGQGNNGTLTNGPTYDSANGGSIVFDGSNDYVDIPNISLTNEFTLSCWLRSSSIIGQHIIFGEGSGSAGGGPKIGIVESNYFIRVSSSADATIAAPATNTWVHVTITRNSSNKIDLYENAGSANRLLSDAAQSGTYTLDKIGANGSDASQNYNGRLGAVHAYNRALSSTEITQNFNALRGRYGI